MEQELEDNRVRIIGKIKGREYVLEVKLTGDKKLDTVKLENLAKALKRILDTTGYYEK